MIPKASRNIGQGCSGKSHQRDISFQLLLGTSASSTESEHVFPLCIDDDDSLAPREVTLNFYLEDGTCQRLVVEENLRAIDLCHLLPLKINVAKSYTWTLVEQLTELGIERSLEDHEEVLQVYGDWGPEMSACKNKFVFRQDFRKYEFFHNPQQFFPLNMLDLGNEFDCLSESTEIAKLITLQNLLNSGEKSPPVQSSMCCREPGKHNWQKLLFRIEDSTLYKQDTFPTDSKMVPFRDLQLHDIYTHVEGKFKSGPTQFAFCLRPSGFGCTSSSLTWFFLESEKQRQSWIAAMRLGKYGKKLRENYKELRSRFTEITSQHLKLNSEIGSSTDSTPSKSRVAMDFTGNSGRVVEDPKEAEAIAAAEGHTWKRRLGYCRGSPPLIQPSVQNPAGVNVSPMTCGVGQRGSPGFEFSVHTLQPWFYSDMSRDEATQLLTKYGTVDGVFLVRESRRNPGCFVLCYVFNHRVHHAQIIPVEEKDLLCYSLDGGRTKFYDLLQLVEFYQLNLGALPSKLTHFFVHKSKSKGADATSGSTTSGSTTSTTCSSYHNKQQQQLNK